MAEEKHNGWDQYSKLVLKEIDGLGQAVTALREEINGLREVLSEMRSNSAHTLTVVNDLKQWKERIDDVASPAQLSELVEEIQKLKDFKTKAVTVFVVVQFGITLFIALKIKGTGYIWCYSPVRNKFFWTPRGIQVYIVDDKEDEKGRIVVYNTLVDIILIDLENYHRWGLTDAV